MKTLNEALGSIRGEVGVAAQNLARGLLIGEVFGSKHGEVSVAAQNLVRGLLIG